MTHNFKSCKVSKESKIGNWYNQVPNLTLDTTWESDKKTLKHNIQENQEASPFPAGDHKAAMNRQESMTNTKHIHERSTALEWSVKNIFVLEGLK